MKLFINLICTIIGVVLINIGCDVAQLPKGSAFWFSTAVIVIAAGWAYPSKKS